MASPSRASFVVTPAHAGVQKHPEALANGETQSPAHTLPDLGP